MATIFECPKCGTATLYPQESKNPDDWKTANMFHCTSCGEVWEGFMVRGGTARPVAGLSICVICEVRPAEVEFRMPVPIPPIDWGKPVGYRMLSARLCSECYTYAPTDRALAESIMRKEEASSETK